ncbi:MAG: flagellar motor switch protein FliN [Oligoflexia bacterium]|nr:flagellar motor switch protein FliN [Oligoflexia bacterium]
MNEAASPLGDINMGDIGAALAAAGSQAVDGGADSAPSGKGGMAPASPGAKNSAPAVQSLDFILDIPLKVTVELGRSKMAIREILQLAQGSVVELSKFAGEPLEVLVNEKLIARGEVVVVNEKFGIRLTDIISPVERIEQLK